MAVDQSGRTIALGETFLLAGIVRRIESATVLVVAGLGEAKTAIRANSTELLRVDDLVHVGGGRSFTANQSTTAYPTLGTHLAAKAYVDDQITALIIAASGLFQPLDATLLALAALSTVADRVPYFTGTDTAALATLTSFGRSLIDDADAAAGRSTLGLGSLATASSVTTSLIGDDQVTFAKIVNAAAAGCSVVGRSANSAGDFAEIAAGSDDRPLRRKSNTLAFGTIDAVQALTVTTSDVLVGRSTSGAGAVELIAVTAEGREILALSGADPGALIYKDGTGAWGYLRPGDAGQVLTMNAEDPPVPEWMDPP